MTSTFPVPSSALLDDNANYKAERHPNPLITSSPPVDNHPTSTASLVSDDLSPFLSHVDSASASPSGNQLETPDASISTLSNYQPSDYSDFEDDPFFGANFDNADVGAPSFLKEDSSWNTSIFTTVNPPNPISTRDATGVSSYPLTPEQTASVHTTSPRSIARTAAAPHHPSRLPTSISPQELQKPFNSNHVIAGAAQWTPSQSSSSRSSEDGCAPPSATTMQSPRVTVSVWDKDDEGRHVQTLERTLEDEPSSSRPGIHSAGELISSHSEHYTARRDSLGRWQRDAHTGQAGLDPDQRPTDEVPSLKEEAARRGVEEKNQDVDKWLADKVKELSIPPEDNDEVDIKASDRPGRDSNDDIPLGDQTENRYIPGQTYYASNGGPMNEVDYEIIAANRTWEDAPILHPIRTGDQARHQPQSSADAIRRFEQMCRDTDSILSRSATWGTRRRSFHSAIDFDVEDATSGNFLKKLSLSRGNGEKGNKQGNLLKELRGMVRRPSASGLLKRSRGNQGEGSPQEETSPQGKRDSTPHLAPPSRSGSWGKKATPSINTALFTVGHNFASIGTTHARKGSVSGAGPSGSPKSALEGLTVKNPLRRPRSVSELPRPSGAAAEADSHPNLVEMLKKSGGPPVASLSKTHAVQANSDEEDDDDLYEDMDMKKDANLIDNVTANFAGFREHVLMLNPGLDTTYGYLVDRIAHQQIIRYKHLLNLKVKHLGLGANCPCGSLCVALGGSANILDQKGDAKGLDPLSSHFGDDDDATPIEGAISQENFPQDIPMPPTQYLPAEFECQLCYSRKNFQKPSDWTKHVHEDVQPFTCTWDKCREPKIFKRKADWVRHENEGHRHLEWWTCDVDDCRHVCYRRDNFLQHLVREHKFSEPKQKTKAAMKKAGGMEPTWQKVEQCHVETTKRPQEEPCRFCGKIFPTWKKLTVHLAKHMEQISLPVLRLVAAKAKELAADTIISPVQDPPPRHNIPLLNQTPTIGSYPISMFGHPQPPQQTPQQAVGYPQPMDQTQYIYPMMPGGQQYSPQFYSAQFGNIGQNLHQQHSPLVGGLDTGFAGMRPVSDMPVTSATYVQTNSAYMPLPENNMTESFPQMNALGLQNVSTMPMGGQVTYDGMMASSSVNGSPFSGPGSVSPYTRSPHQGAAGGQGNGWDDRRTSGFL
ncbi:c2h2 finger domain-containing [Paramyrothecium foliicola]|nr:c2h2 finger domain-containing [Paramyrothecium foliicola]